MKMHPLFCAVCAAALFTQTAAAQQGGAQLEPIIVTGAGGGQTAPDGASSPGAGGQTGGASTNQGGGSLTVPGAAAAKIEIEKTPGGVDLVPAAEYENTRAVTTKDVLDYVPGVFAQPKFGEDAKLSIRGSGLARNSHLRGIKLLQDGVPINLADGGGDFQEIDPLAFAYVQVFKGANGLQYGANSLGGVINFVSPTGRDGPVNAARVEAGSHDFARVQASVGGAHGAWDAFVTGSSLTQDGFRDHGVQDSKRFNGNLGYRISPDAETRFYATYNDIEQDIPGSVTRRQALSDPRAANAGNLLRDAERNIESVRVANKTTVLLGEGLTADFGAFYFQKHLDHPITPFIIDYNSDDYGLFAKLVHEGAVAGHRNRLVFGANLHNGETETKRFAYSGADPQAKGALIYDGDEIARNIEAFAENSFYLTPTLALVLGGQAGFSQREFDDALTTEADANPDDGGKSDYRFFNPKAGFLWQAAAQWQVFGNVSRATEVPTFSELNTTFQPGFSGLEAQKSLTVELGTRGAFRGIGWDIAIYRAWLDNELQLFSENGVTTALNADETIHQGVEAGFDATVLRGLAREGDSVWLRAAYAYSDFRFDGDALYGDNELPGAPRHYLRAELLYKHPSGFYAGPNVEWIPEAYFADNANTLETESYALLGARAGFDFENGMSLFLDGRNLTDEKYISSVSVATLATAASALFNPGDGASVYGGVRYRW